MNMSENNKLTLPKPAPDYILGSVNYYKFRHEDFLKRFPEKDPPLYYMEYGDKYVRKFTDELYGKLSDEGKLWMEKTKLKLQLEIEHKLRENSEIELNEDEFKTFAFESHAKVYNETHAMDLCLSDKTSIIACMDIKDLFGELGLQALKIALHIN